MPITAANIKRFRKQNDLTREELAVQIGVSAQTIWRWEKGDSRIPEPERRLLKQVMEKPPERGKE